MSHRPVAEFTDWVFQLELIEPEVAEGGHRWWCALEVHGTLSIGSGDTPWLALRGSVENIGATIDWARHMDDAADKLMAGEWCCKGCGMRIEPPSEERPMVGFVCDAYPKCGTKFDG